MYLHGDFKTYKSYLKTSLQLNKDKYFFFSAGDFEIDVFDLSHNKKVQVLLMYCVNLA